LLILKATQQNR